MHELKYLNERDLEYFKRQQAEGKPVKIIYLDPDVLSGISFEELQTMDKKSRENHGHSLSEEEMEDWLRRNHAVQDENDPHSSNAQDSDGHEPDGHDIDAKKEPSSERILRLIRDQKLSQKALSWILSGIRNGFSDEELEHLNSLSSDAEKMGQEYRNMLEAKKHESESTEGPY